MGGCFDVGDKPKTKISKEEETVLQIQFCRDKLKNYMKNLEKNAEKKRNNAKEALRNKDKERAKMNLRFAKMYTQQANEAGNKLTMIEDQLMAIRNAQNTRDIANILQEGNKVLKQLSSEVSVEKLQEIADDMEDVKQQQEEVNEFFRNKGLDVDECEKDVEDELENMMKNIGVGDNMNFPSAGKEKINENKNEREGKKRERVAA